MNKPIVLLIVIISVVTSITEETNIVFDEETCKKLTRVVKKVNTPNGYTLSASNKWEQFPNMLIKFQLSYSQLVTIKYNIATLTSSATFLLQESS